MIKYYYLLNTSQYDNLIKDYIYYKHTSLDGTEILVITSQLLEEYLFMFENWKKFILHTDYNANLWSGDGLGVESWELDTWNYIQGIDD